MGPLDTEIKIANYENLYTLRQLILRNFAEILIFCFCNSANMKIEISLSKIHKAFLYKKCLNSKEHRSEQGVLQGFEKNN